MDLLVMLGSPTYRLDFGGSTFGFGELTLESLAALQGVLDREHPHPIEVAKPLLKGLEPEERRLVLEAAIKRGESWIRPRIESAEGIRLLLSSRAGFAELFREAIGRHNPGISRETADHIFAKLSVSEPDKLGEIVSVALGLDPNKALLQSGEPPVPKVADPSGRSLGSPSSAR